MIIRPAVPADMPALADLYGHHVLHGLGTFEEVPPSPEEMARRLAEITGRGLPWLVAEGPAGGLLGYAYAGPFRTRHAYARTVEDSIYIAPDAQGRGIGKALLAAVIDACEALDMREMLAVVGDSGNRASIALHAALGFRHQGVLQGVGFKHGRWVDVVMMQRGLGAK